MSQDSRPTRLTRPGAAAPTGGSTTTEIVTPALTTLLASAARPIDVLPHLHRYAIDATGGTCSLLFEHNPRSGSMQATSAYALDELRVDPWLPGPAEAAIVAQAFARGEAMLVSDLARQMPELSARLRTPFALLLPLTRGDERVGLLAVGFQTPAVSSAIAVDGWAASDAFVTALELFRLRRRDELQRDLRELIDEFSDSISATLDLTAGIEIFCVGANRLFGADRTSVWVHDRHARQLVLQGSSDPEHMARGVSVHTDDALAPAAVALRRTRAEVVSPGDAATSTVTVPLRGCRRALGTIVFDGVRVEAGGELDLLDRADELGRQLSNTIETTQLLDNVLRSRRELENTFDSIWHLVVVSNLAGRIVQVNEAFAGWLDTIESTDSLREGEPPASCEIPDAALKGSFLVTATSLLDSEHRRIGTVLVARDLTPQARTEAEREESRKRLTQSEKLAALGQFVAGIAHELNNPLQGVLGHLELLRVTGAFPKQLRRKSRPSTERPTGPPKS